MKLVLVVCFFFFSLTIFSQENFLQWVKQVGGPQNEVSHNVLSDTEGNLYYSGAFTGTVDFDPGPNVFNLTGIGTTCPYVVKLDSQGNFVWAKAWESLTPSQVFPAKISMCLDSAANVYIAGYGGSDLDPSTGTYVHATGTGVSFIKLDADGNFVWGKKVLASSSSAQALNINDIAIGKNGDLLVCGAFEGTTDFNFDAATNNLTPTGGKDVFVLCVDGAGNYKWTKKMGGSSDDQAIAIDCDSNGNIITTGTFSGSADFDPSTTNAFLSATSTDTDVFISKLDNNGNYLWAKKIGSTPIDFVSSLSVHPSGTIYVAAWIASTGSDVDPGSGVVSISSSLGPYSIVKLSATGNYIWHYQTQHVYELDTDVNGNVYAAGYYFSTFDFDNSANTQSYTPTGGNDAFILKVKNSGTFDWVKLVGGSNSNDQAWGVCADVGGNVFTSGRFDGDTDFDPSSNILNLSSQGNNDGFVMKLTNCIYDSPNICIVTADSLALNNMIYWDKSIYPLADSFVVYRYDALTTNYLRIGAVAMSDPNNYLTDTARNVGGPNGGNPQYSSYRYKLSIRGVCGAMGTLGKYHESIFIQQNSQNFNWNAYAIEGQPSPVTGYQFLRDNTNTGNWQVLVNTGGLSTTDPNYLSYPNGNWRVDALGFSCNSGARLASGDKKFDTQGVIVKSKSNIRTNNVIGLNSFVNKQMPEIKLYPNPAKDLLYVELEVKNEKCTISIENILGQVLFSKQTNSKFETINLNKFETGVYLVKVIAENQYSSQKLIIQK